jgi:hypothetical protein
MAAFERIRIDPQPLGGVSKVDLSTEILGSKLSMPIFVPPMGSHGLAHVSKEEGTAKAAHAVGTLMLTSTQSNLSMEEIAAANPGHKWFQHYVQADRGIVRELLQRAKAAGYTAIAPTVDNLFAYPREENIRNEFRPPRSLGKGNTPRSIADPVAADAALNNRKRDLNWDDLEFIKKESGLPVIVKGVLSPKVAAMAVKRGMDAVYISNHGSRAFDGVQATISALPRIAEAVDGQIPIILRRRHQAWHRRVQGAGTWRHDRGLRPARALRPRARRNARRPKRSRISARQFRAGHAARRHSDREGHHGRIPGAKRRGVNLRTIQRPSSWSAPHTSALKPTCVGLPQGEGRRFASLKHNQHQQTSARLIVHSPSLTPCAAAHRSAANRTANHPSGRCRRWLRGP